VVGHFNAIRSRTPLAAVRRQVLPGGVAAAWRPALNLVWSFVRTQNGLWSGGHNVFVYRWPAGSGEPMTVDFGVEVTRSFDGDGVVMPAETPAGRVATTLHVGPFAARFSGVPDIRYQEDEHFVDGDRGASEWTLSGTTTEGQRLLRDRDQVTLRHAERAARDVPRTQSRSVNLRQDEDMDGIKPRRARPDDAESIADVYLASLRATYDFPLAHSEQQVRRWIADVLLPTEEVWVAVGPGPDRPIVAMMALTSDTLDQLYVTPGWIGRGIGERLITLAKARRPVGLDLYTFQVNSGARRLYERHGFVEVGRGDGSSNDEGQPDVRYAWRPSSQSMG